MIALQSGAQARLPAGKPSDLHVAPPKLGGSHCSSGPTRPSPQRSGPHWLVSKAQSAPQESVPPPKPSETQVAPPRSVPSQSSPGWMPATVPQVAAHEHSPGLPAGTHTSPDPGHVPRPSQSASGSIWPLPLAGHGESVGSVTDVNAGRRTASGATVSPTRQVSELEPSGSAERVASDWTASRSRATTVSCPACPRLPPSTLSTVLGSSVTSQPSSCTLPPKPSPRSAEARICVPFTTRSAPRAAPTREPAGR